MKQTADTFRNFIHNKLIIENENNHNFNNKIFSHSGQKSLLIDSAPDCTFNGHEKQFDIDAILT